MYFFNLLLFSLSFLHNAAFFQPFLRAEIESGNLMYVSAIPQCLSHAFLVDAIIATMQLVLEIVQNVASSSSRHPVYMCIGITIVFNDYTCTSTTNWSYRCLRSCSIILK